MLLKSIRLGTDDLQAARSFYDATFGTLGLAPCSTPAQYPIVIWDLGGVRFILGSARDGEPASHANGGTIIFEAPSEDAVREWHAAGLAHGGTSEGDPETKPQARNAFGAYLRDPSGNKLGVYFGLAMA